MTRVFLLRHAETANPHVFHGAESDVALGERGRLQAKAIAEVLAAHRPQLVVSSAMRRAIETAWPIVQLAQTSLRIEPALHERRVGVLSGMPFHAHDELWPRTVGRWMSGETTFAPEGAESFDDIRLRAMEVWERLTREHAGKTIVIVAHGIVCRVLLLSILPELSIADWQRITTPNVGISELRLEGDLWRAMSISSVPAALVERGIA